MNDPVPNGDTMPGSGTAAQGNSAPPGILPEDLLRTLVELSDDAIVTKTLDGIVTGWNKAAEHIFGYTADEIVGGPISLIIPPERGAEEKEILRRIAQGERLSHFETVRVCKHGRRIDVSATISPLVHNGRIVGASKIARDITQRRKTERELVEARQKLELHARELDKTVTERTAELRATLEQLEKFSYAISHDLRAPLRAINGFADVILKDHAAETPPPVIELVERIRKSGGRLYDLIEQVLVDARTSPANGQSRPVDLATFIPTIIQEYANLKAHSDAIHIAQPLEPVIAIETLLTQVLSNLLGNAVKFASPNRPLAIFIHTEERGDRVRIVLRDNGIGIPSEDQPGIFDLFARAATSKNVEGLGIGLAISRNAVLRMGGQIGVDSTPGEGSTFWIELPAAPSAPALMESANTAQTPPAPLH